LLVGADQLDSLRPMVECCSDPPRGIPRCRLGGALFADACLLSASCPC